MKNLIDVMTEGKTLPDGFDTWGIKTVRPDFRTRNDYQWPFPGGIASEPDMDTSNKTSCPSRAGDGLCVATDWRGMASGGIPARTVLLVAYRSRESFSDEPSKARTSHVYVDSLWDGERLVREHGESANLWGADLYGANLRGANLSGADLQGADLQGANLSGADLQGVLGYEEV